jgi:ribosomal protein S8
MSMSDPIADLLTRIRNAQMVAKALGISAFIQSEGCYCTGFKR